jgi:YHS domain-containing protein
MYKTEEAVCIHIDPVCNMEVDEKTAPAVWEYEGRKYYFCCESCQKDFSKNPENYI